MNALSLNRPESLPPELVAILGDGRLKHWGHAAIAFHPRGESVFSTGTDGTVREWDLATGELLWSATCPARCWNPAISPDGRLLVCICLDGMHELHRWNLDTREELPPLGLPGNKRPFAFEFDLRGEFAAALEFSNGATQLFLWAASDFAAESPANPEQFPLDARTQGHLSLNGDGTLLAASGDELLLWDLKTRRELCRLSSPALKGHGTLAFHPNGRWLLSTTGVGTVAVWNLDDGALVQHLKGQSATGHCHDVVISPDGSVIAGSFDSGTILRWESESWQELPALTVPESRAEQIQFSPDGTLLAAAARGGVRLWNVADGAPRFPESHELGWFHHVALSDDGRFVFAAGSGNRVRRWNLETCEQETPFDFGRVFQVLQIQIIFRQNGEEWLTALLSDGSVFAVPADNTRPPQRLETGEELAMGLAASPEGKQLAIAMSSGDVQLWDAVRLSKAGVCSLGEKPLGILAFDSRGERLAVATENYRYGVGRATAAAFSLQLVHIGHTGRIHDLCSLTGGDELLSVGFDGRMILWNPASPASAAPFGSDAPLLYSVDASPDGRWIGTGDRDGAVHVLDRQQRWKEPRSIRLGPRESMLRDVVFTRDGRHVITANANGTLAVLRLEQHSPPSQPSE